MDISLESNRAVIAFIIAVLAIQLVVFIFLILDNLAGFGEKLFYGLMPGKRPAETIPGECISRNKFLVRATLAAGSIPLMIKGFNIANQAYDYRVKKVTIKLPNLPKAFHGLRIGQISDIHSGSYGEKSRVGGGVDLLIQERPDMIFFTGDLVNQQTDEIHDYFGTFKKVQAPLGVFSILGNHDYGDYNIWPSPQAKIRDFEKMLAAHRELGWDLLRNENRILTENGESLAILGVENWGVKRFSKYGKIEDAYKGTEEASARLLLSHDPSHWEAKVLNYPDIDVTFSGHTHGFQFGIEAGNFRWSPSQYLYNQWAGLYQEGSQQIYVNRGYGFIGLPGRFGIPPEITIFELVKG
jgi:predicted MPP superfamily phosphohydrolase